MIKTFEELTAPLKTYEKHLAWHIIDILSRSSGAIKEPNLINAVSKQSGIPISGVRLRKLVNFIRVNSLAPVMATRRGYFISKDRSVIAANVQSLRERASAITAAADGLTKFIQHEKADLDNNAAVVGV